MRVILCSGYSVPDPTREFVGRGLSAFIQKPYGASELVDTVRHVLGQ